MLKSPEVEVSHIYSTGLKSQLQFLSRRSQTLKNSACRINTKFHQHASMLLSKQNSSRIRPTRYANTHMLLSHFITNHLFSGFLKSCKNQSLAVSPRLPQYSCQPRIQIKPCTPGPNQPLNRNSTYRTMRHRCSSIRISASFTLVCFCELHNRSATALARGLKHTFQQHLVQHKTLTACVLKLIT